MSRREQIMDCEICGRVDHHCVRGVCPECRERFHPDRMAHALERRRESIRTKQRRRDDDALAKTLFVSARMQ